jgi:hypothetical protein
MLLFSSASSCLGDFVGGFMGIVRSATDVSLLTARLTLARPAVVFPVPVGLPGAAAPAPPGFIMLKRPPVEVVSCDAIDFPANVPRNVAMSNKITPIICRRVLGLSSLLDISFSPVLLDLVSYEFPFN